MFIFYSVADTSFHTKEEILICYCL